MNNIQIDNDITVVGSQVMFNNWINSELAVGKNNPMQGRCVIVDAEKVIIREKEVVITIYLAEDVLKQIDSVEINGFKFTKEN